ncbi:hypothetical protein VIGAN_09030300 [Vigna angularis var. angularis]|uniref:Uncharacterized protein n=1 Tax=Vigna angularis var. angularis TaxID=157739 RepID=A0A0S3SVP8_PHAAN|nr:hypothetical protein VIGAN_09030300 [Vigna angularis var. angularis]
MNRTRTENRKRKGASLLALRTRTERRRVPCNVESKTKKREKKNISLSDEEPTRTPNAALSSPSCVQVWRARTRKRSRKEALTRILY